MSDETRLTQRLEQPFDMSSLLAQYPDHWRTFRVENDGFLIVRDNKIISIAGAGHYQHWFANEFLIPPGVQPAIQSQPNAPQQAPADTNKEEQEAQNVVQRLFASGGKS
ncbi:MAG: hypothetical protein AAF412_04145 [Pseudomonadota bacterium]